MKIMRYLFLPTILLSSVILFNSTSDRITPTTQVVTGVDSVIELPDPANTFPAVLVKVADTDSSAPLRMNELKVDVKVLGNISVTTLEMSFFNGLDRRLEGELYFPLGEGQTVSRFAMDVNGTMREGVVVEKEKGRVVFEEIVRKNIDPGLLEWTKGNSFRSRVYPIPANGSKRITVAYEQELTASEDGYIYLLPLQFQDVVNHFEVAVEVIKQSVNPELKTRGLSNFEFEKWNDSYVANAQYTDVIPNGQLGFTIPNTSNSRNSYVEADPGEGADFFYVNLQPKKYMRDKPMPSEIALVWDVSLSAKSRNAEMEFDLLKRYFQKVNNCQLELYSFSNTFRKVGSFSIDKGNWDELRKTLSSLTYDGGTRLEMVNVNNLNVDEVLLSTDGIHNLGSGKLALGNSPIYPISSSLTADYAYLKYVAESTGGEYINMLNTPMENAENLLTQQPYRFIGVKQVSGKVSECYPNEGGSFKNDFTYAGRISSKEAELIFNFGFGQEVIHSETIKIERADTTLTSGLIRRIWAQKKLADLSVNFETNEAEITALGKEFSIVTRNTSLIVLDRLDDYIEHRITPPIELQEEYLAQLKKIEQRVEKGRKEHFEQVVKDFEGRFKWWNSEFKVNLEEIENEHGRIEEERRMMEESEARLAEEERVAASNFSIEDVHVSAEYMEEVMTEEPPEDMPAVSANRMMAVRSSRAKKKFRSPRSRTSTISMSSWDPKSPYMRTLKKTKSDQLYETYLELQQEYGDIPSFYVDVSTYLIDQGMEIEGMRVLSNIAELELENHELLRVLARRLEQLGEAELAVSVFKDVLKIRGEEPQSFRDLALALSRTGEFQEACDILYQAVTKDWNGRFPQIEVIMACEMNNIINKSGGNVTVDDYDARLLSHMPVDVRIVLNWDADNSDMDLWVFDPRDEKCFYSNPNTRIGGHISEDFTEGYGPEEFLLKNAPNGDYRVKVNYFGTNRQRISGPVTIQLQLFTHYGMANEKMEEITMRLTDNKEVIDVGKLSFSNN